MEFSILLLKTWYYFIDIFVYMYFLKMLFGKFGILKILFIKILFDVCIICLMVMNDCDEYEFDSH